MSKTVIWGQGKYTSEKRAGTYGSYSEFVAKAERFRNEQEKAQNYLIKALPAMLKLLEIRITNGEPLVVMRPLRYQTSMSKSDMRKRNGDEDLDKAFYGGVAAATNDAIDQAQNAGFIDVVETINPGTQLILKSLDPNLREFVFNDAVGKEHSISYDDRNAILTQTDIFETVQKLFEGKGE